MTVLNQNQGRTTRPDEPEIVSLAWQCLESSPHFHHHCQTIRVERKGRRLVLSGEVPSFHLKQLAQEVLHRLDVAIDNQIVVVSAEGLSSERRDTFPKKSQTQKPR